MSIVTSQEMFAKAYAGGYAIGAFNVNNMEIIQGITEAAKECNAPVILQVSSGARKYANRTYLVKLVEAAVIETGLPICLHLDHGDSFELCKSCVDDGFSSVMIDASSKPFEENIALTRQVVEYAHAHGVVVEAELGTLAGIEDDVKVKAEDSSYTRPEDVQEFVERTGCDSLAIAIGTSHGAYKFKPEQCTRNEKGILVPPPLRFDILEEVSRRLPGFPIVLHGSSSVPRIDYDYFIIDFMRCQKIKIKILRIIFRLQFIYLVGRDLYHARLPLPGVGETVNIVALPQNRVAVKISAVRLRDFHPDGLGHIIVADSNLIPGHALRQADTQFSLRPRRFILLFDL